jgi:hypothetical protein
VKPITKVRKSRFYLSDVYSPPGDVRKCHYQSVQVYKGKEYDGEFGFDLPVPDMVTVYPTYKYAPYKRDENLARQLIHGARQVADCGYYYQDGRQAFHDTALGRMALVVENFTDLPIDDFRSFLGNMSKGRPRFYCSPVLLGGEGDRRSPVC